MYREQINCKHHTLYSFRVENWYVLMEFLTSNFIINLTGIKSTNITISFLMPISMLFLQKYF